ncbi:MAG: PfkB family carbohydrate kinase [Oscillospiraceae bacterium]|jgi:pyridoxine kinase|nr:PfkB family carbohydrate kinase [Oscillospiraceae bacterium]
MSKRVAVVQDISGLGRCSLAAALPVLSAMGVQCCPVPTAVYTNQTGFPRFASLDCGALLGDFTALWKEHGVTLDGIYTGFMSSTGQLEGAQAFIDAFRAADNLLLVDPVMGDDGKRYPCFDSAFCDAMWAFAAQADVITPNVTEACFLTGTPYEAFIGQDGEEQRALLRRMCEALPPKRVVVTGWRRGNAVCNAAWDGGAFDVHESPAVRGSWSGTGDLFAAALCGGLVKGHSLGDSVRRAMRFLEPALKDAKRLGLPGVGGVPFELHLRELL